MSGADASWLVVVDLQHAFVDPGSPWHTPGAHSVAAVVARLVPRFCSRVVFTRFVPPRELSGSWREYYRKWDFAPGTHASELWSVVAPWEHARSVSSHTFSKWVPELHALLGREPTIVLCGLSTDCCVLATAFAAVDGGARVRVVSDGCAAKTSLLHEAALGLMRERAPQLSVLSSSEELALATG